jgi:hypothetical protein
VLLRQAVEIDRKFLSPGDTLLADDLSSLGRMLVIRRNNLIEAEEFLREGLAIEKRAEVHSAGTLQTARALAELLDQSSRSEEAAAIRKEYNLRHLSSRPATSPTTARISKPLSALPETDK